MADLLPWTKQEGLLLWAGLALLVLPTWRRAPGSIVALWIGGPGRLPGLIGVPPGGRGAAAGHLLPITVENAVAHADRLLIVLPMLGRELTAWERLGLLWPLKVASAVGARSTGRLWAVVVLVGVPIRLDVLVYVFSAFPRIEAHVDQSLSRLLLQLARPRSS